MPVGAARIHPSAQGCKTDKAGGQAATTINSSPAVGLAKNVPKLVALGLGSGRNFTNYGFAVTHWLFSFRRDAADFD